MKRKLLTLIVFCMPCSFCWAQHAQAIFLSNAQFKKGDDANWALPSYDDRQWKVIETGKVWQEQGFPDYHGYAWYRMHVRISSSLKQRAVWQDSLRLFLAHVNDVDETYLNGVLVGKTGAFPNDVGGYISKWPAVREYHVAASNPALKWDAENIIAVRVYDGGGTGGLFMGSPYIDMLEKIDGVSINIKQDSIQYNEVRAEVPLTMVNRFNTPLNGILKISVTDAALRKVLLKRKLVFNLRPLEKKFLRFTVPNQPGIELAYQFTQSGTTNSISHQQTVPYILTPKAPLQPKINSAAVFGVHPGAPLLFKIAATGQKPLQYNISNLPQGLTMDAAGILRGIVADSGTYPIHIVVQNAVGRAEQTLTLKVGSELALTPPMGWNSWNCWGIAVSEDKVRRSAQNLIDKGLIDYGWSYINIDDGWQAPARTADSLLLPNEKFPDMQGLGDWLHRNGLKFGIYSSPGPKTCGGYLGSYNQEPKDVATYTAWGIDYLKYDWCSYDGIVTGDTTLASYIKPFAVMNSALQHARRNIVYNLCQYGMKDVWKWGTQVQAQSWRTTEDIEDTWESIHRIGFEQYPLYPYAGPGHWNDPDMLVVGQVGWGENLHPTRLTPDEQYTHVSLWCLLSAPLLIGCDLSRLDAFTLNLLTNSEVLAIDQDVLGKQAQRRVAENDFQIWVKELADGSMAVGIFNMSAGYRSFKIPWRELELQNQQSVRDVWRQKELGKIEQLNSVALPPHGVLLLNIKEKGGR